MRNNEIKNERNFTETVTTAWVLGCYAVGSVVVVNKASELLAKGCNKLSDKKEAFDLYNLAKSALKNNGVFTTKKYERFQQRLQDERCYVENHPEQFIQTRMKLKNLLQYIENKFDKDTGYYKVDEDMVQAAKEYGKYRYDIMCGKILNVQDIIDVYSWKKAEDAYEEAKAEETKEKSLDKMRFQLRKQYDDYLASLGATKEQAEEITKAFDECFRNAGF